MQTLSIEEAERILKVVDLGKFFDDLDWKLADPVPWKFIPVDSGAKVGLARILANTFLDRGPAILWITETGIWGSSEHMDLFEKYRLFFGEKRTVRDAPVHIFEPDSDMNSLISILSLALFFCWGFEIMNLDRSLAMTVSHDEWIEYRFAPGQESFVSYFNQWVGPQLRSGSTRS